MLDFKVADRVGEIVIRRPAAGNALTAEMVHQFAELMFKAAENVDILTLSGEGADFTIGRDRHEPRSGAPFDAFSTVSRLNKAITAFPGILIAGVRGRASGLGVGLTMRGLDSHTTIQTNFNILLHSFIILRRIYFFKDRK